MAYLHPSAMSIPSIVVASAACGVATVCLLAFGRQQGPPPQSTSPAQGKIVGEVISPHGNGVANARIWVTRPRSAEKLAEGRTRASSAFVLRDVPRHQDLWLHATAPDACVATRLVRVDSPTTATRIRLRSAATMHGRIVDEAGRAIVGAQICVDTDIEGTGPRSSTVGAVTDPDGRYRIEKAPLGVAKCYVRAAGYKWAYRAVALTANSVENFKLRSEDEAPFSVSVRGIDGQPLDSCRVLVRAYDRRVPIELPASWFQGTTDEDGRWDSHGPHQFEYHIRVARTGYQPSRRRVVSLGLQNRECRFVLRPLEKLPLRGRVLDESGNAAAGVQLRCMDARNVHRGSASTDAEGRFSIRTTLSLGQRFRLEADALDRALRPQTPKSQHAIRRGYEDEFDPARTYGVTLEKSVTIRGRILGNDGRPARFQAVALVSSTRRGGLPDWTIAESMWTDGRGRFEFAAYALSRRPFVRIDSRGRGGSLVGPTLDVDDLDTRRDLEFVCRPVGRISGRVLRNGQGVAGVRVVARARSVDAIGGRRPVAIRDPAADLLGETMDWSFTDHNGRYTILDARPGGYAMTVLRSSRMRLAFANLARNFDVELPTGEDLRVDLLVR